MASKKTLFFLILFTFFCQNLFAEDILLNDSTKNSCYSNIPPREVEALLIDNLSIEFSKNKKWIKNLFNVHKDLEKKRNESEHKNWSNFRINKKSKKKFDANIFIKFKNYKKCKFKAKIRLTGDYWWHVNWKKGVPISSLQIKLLDGNIFNVTQFKLFLKEARFGKNEVFVANLFKKLGFISPKTFFLNARINNINYEYIFQEDIKKELLESSFYREGPILEGDERFTASIAGKEKEKFPDVSFAKILNKNFSQKNNSNSLASLEALSNLNKLYLYNQNYKLKHPTSDELYIFSDKYFSEKNSKILNTFDALSYGVDASHGLSMDDRRFYYDVFSKSYLPIYYDGKSKILEKESGTKIDANSIFSIPYDAVMGAKNAIYRVNNLDLESFLISLQKSGLDITYNQLKDTIDKIVSRISLLDSLSKIENIADLKNDFFKKNAKKGKIIKFLLTDYRKKQFFICSFNLENCKTINVDEIEYFKILNQATNQKFSILKRKINTSDYMIFLFNNLKVNQEKFNFFNNGWKFLDEIKTTKIFYKNMNVFVNEQDKKIDINQLENDGKILFLGGKLNKWKINFNGKISSEIKDTNNNYDYLNNLTGCLNFYEIEFNEVNISSKNSPCEDSINIVRSNGNIDSISVNNSSSDGLDVDFSNLSIKNIFATTAYNDCVDFSSGNYMLGTLILKKCTDKALSVGEKSFVKMNKIIVDYANIGLASKDSSEVSLNQASLKNSKVCLSAYNKKKEYNGGFIYVENLECENYHTRTNADIYSKILHKKKY